VLARRRHVAINPVNPHADETFFHELAHVALGLAGAEESPGYVQLPVLRVQRILKILDAILRSGSTPISSHTHRIRLSLSFMKRWRWEVTQGVGSSGGH
jgi:hypothetical protein